MEDCNALDTVTRCIRLHRLLRRQRVIKYFVTFNILFKNGRRRRRSFIRADLVRYLKLSWSERLIAVKSWTNLLWKKEKSISAEQRNNMVPRSNCCECAVLMSQFYTGSFSTMFRMIKYIVWKKEERCSRMFSHVACSGNVRGLTFKCHWTAV